MKNWSDPSVNQTAKTCLNQIQTFLKEKGIKIKTSKHHNYRIRAAGLSYFQDYYQKIGYPTHIAEKLADITNALTIHKEKLIIIKEKYTKDYYTILHELLHSSTCMKTQYKRWVREGLTQHIQKQIIKHYKHETPESLYDQLSYTKTWETLIKQAGEKTILNLYFSENDTEVLKTTTKNLKKQEST